MEFMTVFTNIYDVEIEQNENLNEFFNNLRNFEPTDNKRLHDKIENHFNKLGWRKEYNTKDISPISIVLDLYDPSARIAVEIEFFSGKVERKLMHFEYLHKLGLIDIAILISYYHRNKDNAAQAHIESFRKHSLPLFKELEFKVPLLVVLLKF